MCQQLGFNVFKTQNTQQLISTINNINVTICISNNCDLYFYF